MARQPKSRPKERDSLPLILFMLAVGGTMLYAGLSGPRPEQSEQSSIVRPPPEVPAHLLRAEQVEKYKNETGVRMNRERIQAEYENTVTAPVLPGQENAVKGPALQAPNRLLFEGEKHVREGASNAGQKPADSRHPDVHVEYLLRNEQEAQFWEQSARERYVQDFINNAKAAGIRVKVDKDYNVEVLRSPQSINSSPVETVPFTPQEKRPGAAE